jgi:hypothetical protein
LPNAALDRGPELVVGSVSEVGVEPVKSVLAMSPLDGSSPVSVEVFELAMQTCVEAP